MTDCINTIFLSGEETVFTNHVLKEQTSGKIRGIAAEQRSA